MRHSYISVAFSYDGEVCTTYMYAVVPSEVGPVTGNEGNGVTIYIVAPQNGEIFTHYDVRVNIL